MPGTGDKHKVHTRSDRHLNKQYNLRLPKDLKDAFDDKCKDEGVTFRDAVEHLMRRAVKDNLPLKPEEDYYDY